MADEKPRTIDDRPDDEIARTLDEYPNDLHNDPDDMPAPTAPDVAALTQWRVAKCLLRLRDQINAKFPGRDKESDGTIGDQAHCPCRSDHCPNINDGGVGVVTGMDITSSQIAGSPISSLWTVSPRLPGARTPAATLTRSISIFRLSPARPAPAATTPRATGASRTAPRACERKE